MQARQMWQSPLVAVLTASAMLMPGINQVRADDTETAKNNARIQISRLERELSDQRAKILAADLVIAGAKAALKAEQNKDEPDIGKVIALTLAVGVAEEVKVNLEREKAAKERSLAEWRAYLIGLGG